MTRAPVSRPSGVSNSGDTSVMWSTPNSVAKKMAISTVAGDSVSAMRKRTGVSRSTCFWIWAMSANWRMAVAVSRSSDSKFTVSLRAVSIMPTMRASAWLSDRSRVHGSCTKARKALLSCTALMRTWICAVPRPVASIRPASTATPRLPLPAGSTSISARNRLTIGSTVVML